MGEEKEVSHSDEEDSISIISKNKIAPESGKQSLNNNSDDYDFE